jgi:hypothetical protein
MKQLFLRRGTNVADCILLLILSFISFNCIKSPLDPVGPTYDTQISVPVIDTINYFSEFAQKNILFEFDTMDNNFSYRLPIYAQQKVPVGEYGVKGPAMSVKNNSVIDGIINYEFTNRIPVEMSFEVRFLKWNSAVVRSDTLFGITPDSLIKAPDMNSGAINPMISNIPVVLTGAQVEMMAQADSILIKLYWYVGSDLKKAKFKGEDYIRTRSSASVRFTMDKP